MALTGKRLDELTELTAPRSTDLLYMMADPAANKYHRKVKLSTLRGHVNVRDYGATGDGTTDDTAAIQAAIDAAAAVKGTVFIPAGTYMIGTPLVPANNIRIVGAGDGAVLKATAANTDAIFEWDELYWVEFHNFRCRSANHTAWAFKHNVLTEYTAYCTWSRVEVYAEMGGGWYLCGGRCAWSECQSGYQGTAGASFQPVYLVGGDASTNIFTNRFSRCGFYHAVGVDASVQIETGWNPSFDSCVFEAMDIPAVQAKGVLGIRFQNCNFENIEPGGSYNCPVILAVDTKLSQGSKANFDSCKFQNNGSTPWTAVVYAGSASGASFAHCQGSLGSGYYVMQAGPLYDENSTRLYRLEDEQTVTYGGTANRSIYVGRTADFTDIECDDIISRSDDDLFLSTEITVAKMIDLDDDASTDDYQFDDDQANTTKQTITLTNILPAYAELVSYQIRCIETVTGSAAMTIDLGTTSGGTQLGTGSPDTSNDLLVPATGASPLLAATNAARSLYFSGTPGVNWNTLDAGRWLVLLTYRNYAAVKLHKLGF